MKGLKIGFYQYLIHPHRAGLALGLALCAGLSPHSTQAAQAVAQGTVYGSYNGGNHAIYSNDLDVAVAPDPMAAISNTYIDGGGYTFQYSASAAVDTGQLKVRNLAMSDASAGGSYVAAPGSGVPATYARIEEGITFTPSDSNPYTVSFSMQLDGGYELAPSSTGYALAYLSVAQSTGGGGYDEVEFTPYPSTPLLEFLHVDLTLQGQQTVYLTATLSSQILSISGSNQYSEFAFDNTAQLGLSAPASVLVESDSMLFLTNVPQVPVPAAAWLFGSALIGLVGWRRAGC